MRCTMDGPETAGCEERADVLVLKVREAASTLYRARVQFDQGRVDSVRSFGKSSGGILVGTRAGPCGILRSIPPVKRVTSNRQAVVVNSVTVQQLTARPTIECMMSTRDEIVLFIRGRRFNRRG